MKRLSVPELPNARHLFQIVNSQNNEKIFFADVVVLVEGETDRIFFEAALSRMGSATLSSVLEVVAVGGKGFFGAYTKLLNACGIRHAIIADLDYLEQIAEGRFANLFSTDEDSIKVDVLENPKSRDGARLVEDIESCLAHGDFSLAKETWNYIKARHRQLRSDLLEEERAAWMRT